MKPRADRPKIDPANPFANDALERKPLVEFLEGVIAKAEGPMVMALDSPWGTGKTTLVEMLQAQLEAKKFRCIYFNAWAVDYASDPLVALVSKIDLLDKSSAPDSQRRMKKLKSIATLVGKRGLIAAVKASTLGILDLEKEIEAALAQGTGDATADLFDLTVKESECLSKFREELEAVVDELQQGTEQRNLVFFIDELDRCRPTFAIELLERVKHLFDVPNIVFVLSIDKSQLEISTSSVYGAGINAREYLRRFIDLEFQVPLVTGKPFMNHLFRRFGLTEVFTHRQGALRNEIANFTEVFCELAKTSGMSLRTQEHCVARLALVLDQTPPDYYLYPILVATLIATRAMNSQLFSQIRSGTASTESLMAWLKSSDEGKVLNEHISVTIEAYMNAADPNETRREQRLKQLESDANNSMLDSKDRTHSREVLSDSVRLLQSFDRSPRLDYVIRKIDLAENLRS